MKQLNSAVLLTFFITLNVGAQFPTPVIQTDPDGGPQQGFGTYVLTTGSDCAVFSYNGSSYDGKLTFFREADSLSLDFLTAFDWGYLRQPSKFSSFDSSMIFTSRYINSIWGDRDKYVHYFERINGTWNYSEIDFDSYLGTSNVNINQIELTSHGAFISSSRNSCGYNQTEWYQVLDFNTAGAFNGPFCSVFTSGSQVHAAGDRVFLTKPNDDKIYELVFDEQDNFEETVYVNQDFGQYQTGGWSDVFQIDSLIFCVMEGYDDFYQGEEVVNTTFVQVFGEVEGQVEEVHSFNLSLIPDLESYSLGDVQVDNSGFIANNEVLLRFNEGELNLIGEVRPFPLEGYEASFTSVGLMSGCIVQGVPTGTTAGFGAGEVYVYEKFFNAPTFGCLDEEACNFAPAEFGGIECLFPSEILDCEGQCFNDLDGDGVCDEFDFDTYDYFEGYTAGFQAGIQVAGPNVCGPGTYWDTNFSLCLPMPVCHADLNNDGLRSIGDLMSLLSVYGLPCEE